MSCFRDYPSLAWISALCLVQAHPVSSAEARWMAPSSSMKLLHLARWQMDTNGYKWAIISHSYPGVKTRAETQPCFLWRFKVFKSLRLRPSRKNSCVRVEFIVSACQDPKNLTGLGCVQTWSRARHSKAIQTSGIPTAVAKWKKKVSQSWVPRKRTTNWSDWLKATGAWNWGCNCNCGRNSRVGEIWAIKCTYNNVGLFEN